MSQHTVRPVPAHEPPYYTVVFTSVLTEDTEGYTETAAHLEELVREIPGFLGYEHAADPGGLGITVAYFRDEESIAVWRQNLEHRAAQRTGIKRWYERYSLHVGCVERSHSFERKR
ncbi:antibiotic biosynthesis monooxygenase family protein [Streptomyces yaizuensis]|uniref:Antibiotic biosynthesis monooxygenase n=1 Tax=Streptomyces yaizuensis TaxID=2989713 RepID=A0ABQ5NZL6_9ACTN|nr:antibiotic biosynthesis monooxygenase [Streptomyces sp. YSPA8]GLF95804.1 antibiotic biosynthesis monooxygenase [Streptomyces sp. YSPA8]